MHPWGGKPLATNYITQWKLRFLNLLAKSFQLKDNYVDLEQHFAQLLKNSFHIWNNLSFKFLSISEVDGDQAVEQF